MRLSIEMTPEQHQRLKAVAALAGRSIKDYVLERVLPDTTCADSDEALRQLEAFLQPRIAEAESGSFVKKSVDQIYNEVLRDMR